MKWSAPFTPAARALLAGWVVLALTLAGCQLLPSAPDDGPETGTMSAPEEVIGDVPAELKDFYAQTVAWESCEDSFVCATISVPLDYSDPGRESIDIAVIRADSPGDAQGTILINPGGPGGSGYNIVRDALAQVTTDRLRESYDVLGFDPRGVNRSSAVECLTDDERDQVRQEYLDPDLSDAEAIDELTADAEDFSAKCAKRSGELLGFIDTESAAKDMDILRAIVGDETLNYLGFSYGTALGAAYAELYPQKVGRLVLDGAVDPSLTSEEITLGQARAFEKTLRTFVADCQRREDCPLPGDVEEGTATIQELFRSTEESPMTAEDGRLVTVSSLFQGIILPLYDDVNWPVLTMALKLALDGNPKEIMRLADISAERDSEGVYATNGAEAFVAINCLDYPMVTDPEQMTADAAKLEKVSPTFGRYLAYGGVTCAPWAQSPAGEPDGVTAPGAAPLLVIGTTGDPATPYEWSLSLADQLESAVHVTWESEGHTAYGRAGSCIEDIVDSYFIDGTVPKDGVRCPDS